MKYLFLINPAAGKGKYQTGIADAVRKYFDGKNEDFEIVFTSCAGDAEQRARGIAETGERVRIFAAGGEGTVYEAANGIRGFDNAELGVIPCGTANDFLKYFGDAEPFRNIEAQVNGKAFYIDLIDAGGRLCLNGCSVGMDAMVARDMNLFKRLPAVSGSMAYKLAVLRNFFTPRLGVELSVSVDGGELKKGRWLFAVIANAPYYGGGYKGAPTAVPNDGILDFTCVEAIPHLRVPKFLSRYKRGEFSELSYCSQLRCSRMRFVSERAVPVNRDGEISEETEMSFSLCRDALRFVVPAGAALPETFEENANIKKF